MYNKNYDCVRSLIVRSPSGSSPVDFNVNINIEAKDYDKIHLQLLSVNFDQENDGSFPVDSTKKTSCFFVESNMGQMVIDTNQKRTFLGSVNVMREFTAPTSNDSNSNPIIELASIPNGNFNFSLKDVNGNLVTINDGSNTALKASTFIFQIYLSKNEIKRNQINI